MRRVRRVRRVTDVDVVAQTNEIKRADVRGAGGAEGGGAVQVVADAGVEAPRALALDWAARVLYYVSRGALVASGLRGEYAAPLLPDMAALQSIAVDPIKSASSNFI